MPYISARLSSNQPCIHLVSFLWGCCRCGEWARVNCLEWRASKEEKAFVYSLLDQKVTTQPFTFRERRPTPCHTCWEHSTRARLWATRTPPWWMWLLTRVHRLVCPMQVHQLEPDDVVFILWTDLFAKQVCVISRKYETHMMGPIRGRRSHLGSQTQWTRLRFQSCKVYEADVVVLLFLCLWLWLCRLGSGSSRWIRRSPSRHRYRLLASRPTTPWRYMTYNPVAPRSVESSPTAPFTSSIHITSNPVAERQPRTLFIIGHHRMASWVPTHLHTSSSFRCHN